MREFERGRFLAREARTSEERTAALALRGRCFRGGAPDADAFDPICRQIVVNETQSGATVCTFRLMPLAAGTEIDQSYAAQFYALDGLAGFSGPMVEMGRFCIDPDYASDPDVLRVAWGALTTFVDGTGVEMLFGCASFVGLERGAYRDTFALLKERHLAPKAWLPRVKAPSVFRFGRVLGRVKPDLRRAMGAMPPLLKSYLMMGGWVSDHAVVDRDLGTLHVFTGLEVGRIPPARARRLRALAG